MHKTKKSLGVVLLLLAVIVIAVLYLSRTTIPVLQPRGPIADQEFRLLVLITAAMLVVVVPVFILLAYVIWRYREDSPKPGRYLPDWEHSRWLEGLWWAIPTVLIVIVSVITWNATYALNPYRPIETNKVALNIEVISLDWRWLFIYPNQHIASVNLVEFPLKTPVHFYLTSDAPMNSFWLPQLSGQIYAMAGMQTQLYLSSDVKGTFIGRSANISGTGFASMQFSAKSVSQSSFNTWAKQIRAHSPTLSMAAYMKLAQPGTNVPTSSYSNPVSGLFNSVISSFMMPASSKRGGASM